MHYIKHLVLEQIMNLSQKHPCEQWLKKPSRLNQKKCNIVHIVTKRKMSTMPIFTGFVDIFYLSNCQRWEYNAVCYLFQIYITVRSYRFFRYRYFFCSNTSTLHRCAFSFLSYPIPTASTRPVYLFFSSSFPWNFNAYFLFFISGVWQLNNRKSTCGPHKTCFFYVKFLVFICTCL